MLINKTKLDSLGFKNKSTYFIKNMGTNHMKNKKILTSTEKEMIRKNWDIKKTVTIGVQIIKLIPRLHQYKGKRLDGKTLELLPGYVSFSIDKSILPVVINSQSDIDSLTTSFKNKKALKFIFNA